MKYRIIIAFGVIFLGLFKISIAQDVVEGKIFKNRTYDFGISIGLNFLNISGNIPLIAEEQGYFFEEFNDVYEIDPEFKLSRSNRIGAKFNKYFGENYNFKFGFGLFYIPQTLNLKSEPMYIARKPNSIDTLVLVTKSTIQTSYDQMLVSMEFSNLWDYNEIMFFGTIGLVFGYYLDNETSIFTSKIEGVIDEGVFSKETELTYQNGEKLITVDHKNNEFLANNIIGQDYQIGFFLSTGFDYFLNDNLGLRIEINEQFELLNYFKKYNTNIIPTFSIITTIFYYL